MLYFLIPFKSQSVSSDWGKVCKQLAQTLESICNQTDDNYKVLVICHDLPELRSTYKKVRFCQVQFPPPSLPVDSKDGFSIDDLHADKGRKMIYGLSIARDEKADFIMFVDADDLVNRHISAFVKTEKNPNGWVCDRGYRMDESCSWLLYPRNKFNHECGTSHILRTKFAPFPDAPDYTLGLDDYYIRRYVVHAYVADNLSNLGHPLSSLPFFGAIYLFNDQSIYSSKIRQSDSLLRKFIRVLVKGRVVTKKIKLDFGLFNKQK